MATARCVHCGERHCNVLTDGQIRHVLERVVVRKNMDTETLALGVEVDPGLGRPLKTIVVVSPDPPFSTLRG